MDIKQLPVSDHSVYEMHQIFNYADFNVGFI